MKDQFGRELTYLRISVVDRCNLRCLYCMPAHGAGFEPWKDLLSYEEIARLVRVFGELGIRKVRITGGEPLVRRDIEKLIAMIREVPQINELALSTNGVFLKGMAATLKNAGVDRLNVSLDTLQRSRFEEIARMDRLNEVLDGIDEALASGMKPLKLNTVLMRGINDAEILNLTRFAVKKRISIRFIELMPTDKSVLADPQKHFFSTQEARAEVEKEFRLTPADAYASSPSQNFKIDGTDSQVGFISPISNFFCSRCNRLRIKANGMLKTCLHGKEDLDMKLLLRGGISDEELKQTIQKVVYIRPEQHFLNDRQVQHNDFQMSHVGG
jgi:GTP 3',8-cyclase